MRTLRLHRFFRSASIHVSTNGRVSVADFDISPPVAALMGLILGAILANYVHPISQNSLPSLARYATQVNLVVVSGASAIVSMLVAWLFDLGVDDRLLARLKHWILRDETAIVVEVKADDVAVVLDLMGRAEGGHPVTFVLHPQDDYRPKDEDSLPPLEPVSSERLSIEADRLAKSLRVAPRGHRQKRTLLQRLMENESTLQAVHESLSKAVQLEQSISVASEWLLDNAYIVQGHIDEFRRSLPRRFYEELPLSAGGRHEGLPRSYAVANELVALTDARLDRENIQTFLRGFQSEASLTIGELWSLPLMLRLRLIECVSNLAVRVERRQQDSEWADFWANRLMNANRRQPLRLLALAASLAEEQLDLTPHLADQLVSHLYDEESVLSPVRLWAEQKLGSPLEDVFQAEQRRQAAEQVALGNSISSLRFLSQVDWREIFEAVSRVDAELWADPAGAYPNMDFLTRDRYRHSIEEIVRGSKATEETVAHHAIELARAADRDLERHVGYYFVDSGRQTLESLVGSRPPIAQRIRRWAFRHPAFVYFSSISAMVLCVVAAYLDIALHSGAGYLAGALFGMLLLAPAFELAVQISNYLLNRLIPPRVLPKMLFEEGIPDEWRTLVAVPMMLLTPESIREEVERLEIRSLANPDPNLRFALVSDFADAPEPHMPEDANLLDVAVCGIRELNRKYATARFSLFHRERQWSGSEQRWMGWERKRGKIEQLNRYLLGDSAQDITNILLVGEKEQLGPIRNVITLDSDTQLPRDTARRLVETIAHPLNRAQLSADGSRVERGYTIIQPRITTSLPSATETLFSRIFTDPAGTDPYTRAISDVYMDLFGEGSYHGKGIYDLQTFHQVLSGRFPESCLLSHDLIEGAHVRVGLASDIELLDLFPSDYVAFASRQHRWVRGDWQILDWLFPAVPAPAGRRPNTLSVLNQWKILDNLRRSLTPACVIAFIALGWLFPPLLEDCCLVVAALLLLPSALQLATRLTEPWKLDPMVWKEPATNLLRTAVFASVYMHQAALNIDAIVRVLYRRTLSHRLMLEWQSSTVVSLRRGKHRDVFFIKMTRITVLTVVIAAALYAYRPLALVLAAPFLALWFFSPMIAALLSTPLPRKAARDLSSGHKQMLRHIARQTWRYFDDFVGPETNWLPPDNYQEFLRKEIAPRTSPTNIGLWLLSVLAAHDLGYLTTDGLIERIESTILTLGNLERHEGHLLNWYDVETLTQLNPRYVSTADSGNLLGALWALEQGLEEVISGPVIGPIALHGLADPLALLCHVPHTVKMEEMPEAALVKSLEKELSNAPKLTGHLIIHLRAARKNASDLAAAISRCEFANDACRYWSEKIVEEAEAWNEVIDLYLPWVEMLDTAPPENLLGLDKDVHTWRHEALGSAPTLRDLAAGAVPGLSFILECGASEGESGLPESTKEWLDRLRESALRSQKAAAETISRAEKLLSAIRILDEGMNMRFLYHSERRVFSIGYQVAEGKLDSSYYDLLASEARIASLVSIARGQAPLEHWWALGRPFGLSNYRRPLLSWNGTMFEYLMPLLLTRSFDNSLLDQACKAAVACQIAYGRQRGIPWGFSESAFAALDANQVYQYRAFGVPGLGLKRGLEADLVVAPYASALALAVDPHAAIGNLKRLARLARLGMRGGYGYYEAIDYTRHHGPRGERGVIVYAYMAHHQGMSLLAIDNALNGKVMQHRFHRDPRVQAVESLLYERIPIAPALVKNYTREAPPPRLAPIIAAPLPGKLNTAETPTPRAHLLSNRNYSVMVTNAGGGYSRWKDMDITRWRADTTRDAHGAFIYVRDLDSGVFWSVPHHPVCRKTERYSANFTADKAEFRRRDTGIDTNLEIVVSAEDDAEIRHVAVVNRSLRRRRIEFTSYAELALAPHESDRAHPAFNKLFIQTQALPDLNALLAFRRRRSPDDPPVWALHVACMSETAREMVQFETDRARFLGRSRSYRKPSAMEGDLSCSAGAVLDPIFSLRHRVELEPGQRLQISFITGAAETREAAVALAEKYSDMHASHRAIDMAWTHAQLELRRLRIQPDDAQRFQQLAGHILYPDALFRPPEERLRRNILGQSRLWSYGISGDLPIVAVTIENPYDVELVREVLVAHSFWRIRGLKVDLVILNEEAASYEQPLQEQLRRLVQSHSEVTGTDRPGGVFLRPAAQIPEEDLTLILESARVVLVAARRSLSQQLGAGTHVAKIPVRSSAAASITEDPSPPLPFMELPYFNGLGGFTHDGKEYAIYLGPGDQTPAPWVNVIANSGFGALVSESGSGFAWCGNSQANRLTPWSNDPVLDPLGDALYLRDEDSGIFWTPNALPVREIDAYRARHGQGYTVFEHNSHAIEQELATFVPMNELGGAPVRIQRLRLRNASRRKRRLTVSSYVEWVIGTDREQTQTHVFTSWDRDSRFLCARNAFNPDFGNQVAFSACSPVPSSYTSDRMEFLGRNGSSAQPAAMRHAHLSGRTGAGLDPCAAQQVSVELDSGEEKVLVFLLGETRSLAEAREIVRRFRDPEEVDKALGETRAWWDSLLEHVQVETPDLGVNFLLNRWLIYQTLSCRTWARSAFYQSGGAFGFRDQLQDAMALVYCSPGITREQILRSASRQFIEGDVQHWWHPEAGAGVRTRISDDLLWLPFVTAHYVRVTGDAGILEEQVNFLEGPVLEPEEHETYFQPSIARETAPLMEHCRRAIEKGLTSGPHGLPLIGGGDWNDGMNRVGVKGKGESVWLAWFLIHVLNDFAELLDLRGEEKTATDYRVKAVKLARAAEDNAWDGAWYRRAFFDDGTPMGSAQNPEAQIDSLPQSWAVISGAANPERAKIAMQAVEERLVRAEDKMVLLFTPPFDNSDREPGYIKGYPPGVRENGAQYTHGSLWVPMAFARQGDGDKAVALLRMMSPIEHTRTPEETERYKVEPYVVAADVYSLEGQAGRGGWTWYTGSAGWMYRIWLEEVLGFHLRGEELIIDPCISSDWPGFTLRYRYRSSAYEIQVENPDGVCRGVRSIELDGEPVAGPAVPLRDDGALHTVRVRLGATASTTATA